MKKQIQKICGLAAALWAAFSLSSLGAVAYYQKTLPDQFYVSSADAVSFSGATPFSFATGTDERAREAAASVGGSQNFFTDVNLFGLIPVKDVHVSVADKPVVTVSGRPFGVKMYTDGAVVVGISPVKTKDGAKTPGEEAGLQVGDVIVTLGGQPIKSYTDITAQAKAGQPLICEYMRGGSRYSTTVTPALSSEGGYKLGVWVRDSSAGIGTMTFVAGSGDNLIFAGLGHGISDVDTKDIMPLATGEIVSARISGVQKGQSGTPGELKGLFTSEKALGTLRQNGETGVYGLFHQAPQGTTMPVAYKQEVKEGAAQILCTLDGDTPKLYDIDIEKINLNDRERTKNLLIRVTDSELLEKAGGIVQGMSGSPIIQNNQLVGAVTHVLVNDPTRGYGIFAENMWESTKTVSVS